MVCNARARRNLFRRGAYLGLPPKEMLDGYGLSLKYVGMGIELFGLVTVSRFIEVRCEDDGYDFLFFKVHSVCGSWYRRVGVYLVWSFHRIV